jgi:hypothetical protein
MLVSLTEEQRGHYVHIHVKDQHVVLYKGRLRIGGYAFATCSPILPVAVDVRIGIAQHYRAQDKKPDKDKDNGLKGNS